jgi:hypothetical protein
MLKAVSSGYLINRDVFCENVCDIEPILRWADVNEFLDMLGENVTVYLKADSVSSLYESYIRENNQNIYTRLALLAARTIIRMFEERLLPEEGLYIIDSNCG